MNETIFLDTSIFIANNFLEGKRIQEIFKLSKANKISVVIPKLVYDEIINQGNKQIDSATQKFKKYRDDTRVLRNLDSIIEKFEPFDSAIIKKEFKDKFDSIIEESHFTIIDYPSIEIKDIFRRYFTGEFPFGTGNKKQEFPDAFSLEIIENWAKTNSKEVLIFSKDGDFLKYKGKHIKIVPDFDKFLSDKIESIEIENLHNERIKKIEDIITNRNEELYSEIQKWLEEQLDDLSKYYVHSNNYEVHDYEILEINLDFEDYELTNSSSESISVQIKTYINYKVRATIDDEEYMFKDEDTKEWVFYETTDIIVSDIKYINVDVEFYIDSDDKIMDSPEIIEINDGRELKI